MIATCSNCESKFRVDDSKLGPRGAKVKCSKCGTTFIVRPEISADSGVRVGDAPAPKPLPPEPTPLPFKAAPFTQEFPVEFTPALTPAPIIAAPALPIPSLPPPPPPVVPVPIAMPVPSAAVALAPPLPGPSRVFDDSRFDVPPNPPSIAPPLAPPPVPRALPKLNLPPPPPLDDVPPAPLAHDVGGPLNTAASVGPAFDGIIDLDASNDFEPTSPGIEEPLAPPPAVQQAQMPPLQLPDLAEPAPAAEDSLLDLAGPAFALDRPSDDATKPSIDLAAFKEAPESAQDLFDASFASPLAPAPVADEPTTPMTMPTLSDEALAGMPSFEEPSEFQPEFSGGMSQDGIVTKNVDVSQIRAQLQSQAVASIALDRPDLRDEAAQKLVEAPPRTARAGGPLVILASGLVLIVALALAAAYFAGGWQGLREAKGPAPALSVENLRVIPYATHDGSRFWIVRGSVKNHTQSEQATRVEVTGGGSSASAELGMALDPLALYARGDVAFIGTPLPSLKPGASAEFSAALSAGAVPDASMLRAQAVPR